MLLTTKNSFCSKLSACLAPSKGGFWLAACCLPSSKVCYDPGSVPSWSYLTIAKLSQPKLMKIHHGNPPFESCIHHASLSVTIILSRGVCLSGCKRVLSASFSMFESSSWLIFNSCWQCSSNFPRTLHQPMPNLKRQTINILAGWIPIWVASKHHICWRSCSLLPNFASVAREHPNVAYNRQSQKI